MLTFSVQHFKMVHGELQYLGLLQLGAALLLAGRGHQSLEFSERGVDPVATLLLDHSSPTLASHQLAGVPARRPGRHQYYYWIRLDIICILFEETFKINSCNITYPVLNLYILLGICIMS